MKYRFPKENVRWFWAHIGMAIGIAGFCFWARDFFFGDAVWIAGNVILAVVQARKAWRGRRRRHRYITYREHDLGEGMIEVDFGVGGQMTKGKPQMGHVTFTGRTEEERWE